MFSFNGSSNPFSQLPSSFHIYPPPFAGLDGSNLTRHHHHHEGPLTGHRLLTNASVIETLNDISELNGEFLDLGNLLPINKKPAKKDRHSKIFTAQGQRDRRVRLSIEIARKFFDLQDMLGYDKASKTIDWLLTKSKTAIRELELELGQGQGQGQTMHNRSGAAALSSLETTEANRNGDPQDIVLQRNTSDGATEEKKMIKEHKSVHSRESRTKARERARERTREKLSTSKINESNKLPSIRGPIIKPPNPEIQIETFEKLASNGHKLFSSKEDTEIGAGFITQHRLVDEAPSKDMVEESIRISKKMKSSPTLCFEHDFTTSKDVNSNSNNYFPNTAQQWDLSGTSTSTSSSFCVMTPQTAIDNCSKPWEVYYNQFQR